MRTIRHPVGYTLPVLRDRLTKIVYDPDTDTSTPQPWNLNDPSVDHVQLVLTDEGTEVLSAEMLIDPGVEGDISYAWQPGDVDQAGRLVAIEQIHTVSGVQAAPAFIIEFYDPLVVEEAESPLCQPWFDPAALTCPGETIPVDADSALVACEYLYVASGYQYSGICTSTVRPCTPDYGCLTDGCWSCAPPYNVVKLYEPVVDVQSVLVNGEVLDASEYRLYDHRYLQKTVGGWPWQNLILPPGEVGTWSVTFTHGTAPPLAGVLAAQDLACRISAGGVDCTLPPHVVSLARQGVNQVFDPAQSGVLSIPSVSSFLQAFGYGEPRVWSPDLPPNPAEVI